MSEGKSTEDGNSEVEVKVVGEDRDPGESIEVDEEERLEVLGEDVAELTAQNAVLLDSLKRLKADFDNYRKRMVKEQTHILQTAEAGLIRKLLPIIDNLERALQSEPESEAAGLKEGVVKVLELMLDTLA